ncbi:MAG: cold-shock protein [Alphaproteobacteria bacterium CG_4_10_14_0_8_um_filter_53_9]|nr:MAG: cold-shock protein [Alphaproteobacteria bacterium CG_4_10_14_0_8_um_filter_53_9]
MAKGTVKWFNETKGFGFIAPEEGGKDVFVHITALQAAGLKFLKDGQPVTYELEESRGRDGSTKQSAINLKIED